MLRDAAPAFACQCAGSLRPYIVYSFKCMRSVSQKLPVCSPPLTGTGRVWLSSRVKARRFVRSCSRSIVIACTGFRATGHPGPDAHSSRTRLADPCEPALLFMGHTRAGRAMLTFILAAWRSSCQLVHAAPLKSSARRS